jgi:hypothetical protein
MADLKNPTEQKRQRRASQFLFKHQMCQRRSCFEGYYWNGSYPWFREIKMNLRVFVSTNHMRAGHCILEANLRKFDCAHGWMRTWCQAAYGGTCLLRLQIVRGPKGKNYGYIVREKQKGILKASYRALRLEGKKVWKACYIINNIPTFILQNAEVNARNINSMLFTRFVTMVY